MPAPHAEVIVKIASFEHDPVMAFWLLKVVNVVGVVAPEMRSNEHSLAAFVRDATAVLSLASS